MKKNDIAIIVAVAIVAGVFSFIVAKMIFGGDQKYSLTAPTVDVISAEFNTDTVYLNDKSIDLTKDITVQSNDNSQPFNSAPGN